MEEKKRKGKEEKISPEHLQKDETTSMKTPPEKKERTVKKQNGECKKRITKNKK